jgi:hypothetical protein
MKTNLIKLSIVVLFISFTSCSNDDDKSSGTTTLETKMYSNLYAPQTGGQGQPTAGEFAKFSFADDAIVTSENWDIAFRGTTLIVNGGTEIGLTDEPTRTGIAAISTLSSTFDNVTTIPAATTFAQDEAGIYAFAEPWYDYNSTTHIISPVAGRVYVVKTHNGKYAKFEILSYYQDAPANPDMTSPSRYFTFKYVYQSESETNF